MNVLVINCGSSTIKYQLINTDDQQALAAGSVERIGMADAVLSHQPQGREKVRVTGEILDHIQAIEYTLAILLSPQYGVIRDTSEIDAVGHRVVHGGEKFSGSVILTDEVMAQIRECIELAPLHNPHNVRGIEACQRLMPKVPEVAVFDTAFHQTMPDYAYMYALPWKLYERHAIRRYGFHGTSHGWVAARTAELLGRPISSLKMVTCHLGNGCSIAAVDGGKSVDTSMGFTPLEGLVMGTRSGDIDPAIILHVIGKEDLNVHEATALLNKHSGMLGLSGVSGDMREIEAQVEAGDPKATLALRVYCYRIRKYIAAYAGAMGGLDTIVFTAGVGENSSLVRKLSCEGLTFMGVELDDTLNGTRSKTGRVISTDTSRVKVVVMPTNEELAIALETARLVAPLRR
ncbi:MAG TPA: acetate kinase [Candidatus Latescibacteria bacterium]|nr:acetate kinase [Candidatus Latescibacterota bacterium]